MAIVGISLAILLPLWLYVNSSVDASKADLQVAYARNSLAKIKEAADAAFVEGPPARFSLFLNFPSEIDSASVSGNEVLLRLRLLSAQGALSDVYAVTIGNVTGSLPVEGGLVRVLVSAEYNQSSGENYVNITTAP